MPTQISPKLLAASICGILSTSAALAAAPAAPVIEEVIVTAQMRAQDVNDVPIAMDVISPEQLATAGFNDANDLSKVAPVAVITQDQGSVRVTIRGIGDVTAGGDTSVTSNIDGEYLNGGRALAVSLFDIERVEVLRGPQGTLYGRNSTAGAVNYVMRKPGDTLAGNVSASYGDYNTSRIDGGVSVPLATGIGMRVAGFYEDRDGYVSHPGRAAGTYGGFVFPGYSAFESDDNTAYGARLSFQGRDLGNFSFYAAGEYSNREFTPQVFAAIDTHQAGFTPGANCGAAGWERAAPLITSQTLCIPSTTNYKETLDRSEYAAPANGGGRQYWDTYALRARLDYEFSPAATLSYLVGYRNFEVDPKSTASLPVVYANTVQQNESTTQSHELRLAGDVNGWIYQFGGFLFKQSTDALGGFYLGDVTQGTTNAGLYINYNLRNSDNKSTSAFGQVDIPLTDTLTAVAGVRHTKNENEGYWRDKVGFFGGPRLRTLDTGTFSAPRILSSDESKTTWLAGLNYKPNADTLVYGKISTGFKGGGFDSVGTYDPETNTAYETGLKLQFGDSSQNQFNASAFYYDYSGLQVGVLLNSATGGQTFNAGAATIWGIETDTLFELTENDHISLGVNYLHAKLDEMNASFNVYCVPLAQGGVGTCPGSIDAVNQESAVGDLNPALAGIQSPSFNGNTLANSPEWIATLAYDHVFDLASGDSLTFRADTSLKSKYYTTFYNYEDMKQKAYTLSNVALEYKNQNGFGVSAFVRNIENKRYLTNGYFLAAGPDDIWNYQFGSPRLYGLRVSMDW